MLHSMRHWVKQQFWKTPGVRWGMKRLILSRACQEQGRGTPTQILRRLLMLHYLAPDRFPIGTDIRRLTGWLDTMQRLVPARVPGTPRRVLLFAAMTNWVEYGLPLAMALASRGCFVDYIWVPHRSMQAESVNDERCRNHSMLAGVPAWTRIHPRVRIMNLLHLPAASPRNDATAEIELQAHRDTQYILRRERIDYDRLPAARTIRDLRITRHSDCLKRLTGWLQSNAYDSALVPNSAIFEFATAFRAFKAAGLQVVSFDFGEIKGNVVHSDTISCMELNTEPLWQADVPHVLTPEREQRIMPTLMRREKPNWQEANYSWQGQVVAAESIAGLRQQLRLDPERPVALLCTNVSYDSAVLGKGRTHTTMSEWILDTIEWFKNRPDWNLLVRCHPAEAIHKPGETVADMVHERFPVIPDNVRLILPTDAINTYGLMPLARFGLIYTSTIGMEMACRGIPIVLSARVHYGNKGFTIDPRTRDDYFTALNQMTAPESAKSLSPRQLELARCYADIYFSQFQRPVPWYRPGYTNLDMERCSFESILTGDAPKEYLDTLDYFAGFHYARPSQRAA